MDGYEISTVLHGIMDSHLPISDNEIEFYIETVKRLKETSIVTSQQVDFLR